MKSPAQGTKKTWHCRVIRSPWVHLAAAFVVLALIQTFVVKLYSVPSSSMQQTLAIGDRILIDRLPSGPPEPGDVIVFAASRLWGSAKTASGNPITTAIRWAGGLAGIGPSLDHVLVKRVIAGPGQTVSCCDIQGRLMVDGKPIDEPYIFDDLSFIAAEKDCSTVPASQRCFAAVHVPAGQFFVLGDHRSDSDDSIAACRVVLPQPGCLKMVGKNDVIGRAIVIVFPFNRWGLLDNASTETRK